MRLGQLARKLALRQSEIVEFLAIRNVKIDEGSNARVSDEHTTLVIQHFAPGLLQNGLPTFDEPEKEESKPGLVVEPITTMSETPAEINTIASLPGETEVSVEEKPEVIKAPKVELPGLKVLGKIEIPEQKKKEPAASTETPAETPTPTENVKAIRSERKDFPRRPERKTQSTRKNPIAAQREREATEAEKKRRAAAERERRTDGTLL